MPKGTGRPDNRDEREARDRDRSNQDRARQEATKAKQKDLEMFGDKQQQVSEADLSDLGRSIDEMNRRDNFISDFFGINHSVKKNPNTNQWDVAVAKEVSPLGMAAGLLGGLPGKAAAEIAKAAGFEDPLGFEVDLGFVGDTVQKSSGFGSSRGGRDRDQRDDRESLKTTTEQAQSKTSTEGSIDDIVADLLEGQKVFNFADMPDFKLLTSTFGDDMQEVDLGALLQLETK